MPVLPILIVEPLILTVVPASVYIPSLDKRGNVVSGVNSEIAPFSDKRSVESNGPRTWPTLPFNAIIIFLLKIFFIRIEKILYKIFNFYPKYFIKYAEK
jgi:uncharacterized membrane protein YobD (UPF0266 family)